MLEQNLLHLQQQYLNHVHLNDGTVAGMKMRDRDVFSVQYHPESSPGPHDSRYLFDNFVDNMKKAKGTTL